MSIELPNHSHSGSFNNGQFKTLVNRCTESFAGRVNYIYDVVITRVSDGERVRVSLTTFRKYSSTYGNKMFPSYRFQNWMSSNGISSVAAASVRTTSGTKPTNNISIAVRTTKKASIDINIVLKKDGDSDELAEELRELIEELEDAIRDLEEY